MTASPAYLSPDKISEKDFTAVLIQYPALIESISAAKPAKPGQKPLVELDQFRYVHCPNRFRLDGPKREGMEIDDVKHLVEWKLRHGKFRPTLMKLVTSNPVEAVKSTMDEALEAYQDKGDVQQTLKILTRLKGIGPATASLLLSVIDPGKVIFFSDEAFYWLCCGGKPSPIKYDKKEYGQLQSQAQKLVGRLGVSPVDVEKVAYVLIKKQGDVLGSQAPKVPAHIGGKEPPKKPAGKSTKRKRSSDDNDVKQYDVPRSTRRSERNRPKGLGSP